MIWVDVVTLLALVQFVWFAAEVARARNRYGVRAPAITGNDMFERYFRVHYNTLEMIVLFIPSLWIAARHWFPMYVAAIGVVYLIGRMIYYVSYVRDPKTRSLGASLTILPIAAFWIIAGIDIVRELING